MFYSYVGNIIYWNLRENATNISRWFVYVVNVSYDGHMSNVTNEILRKWVVVGIHQQQYSCLKCLSRIKKKWWGWNRTQLGYYWDALLAQRHAKPKRVVYSFFVDSWMFIIWLVVSTPLKNDGVRQMGLLFPIYGKS